MATTEETRRTGWAASHRRSWRERALTAGRRARNAWSRYWARRAARATVGLLRRLDDRTLKDIGLDRSEIECVAHGDEDRRTVRCQPRRKDHV